MVGRITEHGVMNVSEMNPDLMCPSGLQLQLQKRKVWKPLKDGVICDGTFSLLDHCHAFPVRGTAPNVPFYCAGWPGKGPPDKCMIPPAYSSSAELFCEVCVCGIAFCHNEES